MSETRCYRGFTACVEFDPDEQVLHGRVEAIRDVVTFQASSVEEVPTAFEEAVDDYLNLGSGTECSMGAH